MSYIVKITFDSSKNIYKIDDGSWVLAWDNVNDTHINEFGFKIVENQINISSDYDFITINPINYSGESRMVMFDNSAIFTDTMNSSFQEQTIFIFNITYRGGDVAFCEDKYGNPIDTFIFSGDGVVYGSNSGDETIVPESIGFECCTLLGYDFDPDFGKCYWSVPCNVDDIKIVINPDGNDGALFQVDEGENCVLDISFDWLLEYDCQTLLNCLENSGSIMSILSGVTMNLTLERVISNTTNKRITNQLLDLVTINDTVYEETLFNGAEILNYFENENSGIILIGGNCNQVVNIVETELSGNTSFSGNTLYSDWMHFHVTLTDPTLLALIKNEKIKIGLNISNSSCDMSILVDNIKLNRMCEIIDIEETFVAKCPSFNLNRTIDNKKSWVAKNDVDEREFNLSRRETDYYINHHKLGINSKEVDLNINPARAIEMDVMNSILQNPCLIGSLVKTNLIIIDLQDNLISINGSFFPNEESDFSSNDFGFTFDGDLIVYSKDLIESGVMTTPSGYGDGYINDNTLIYEYSYGDGEVVYLTIVTSSGIDINALTTTDLFETTFTLEEFNNILLSELIDVKDRQTIRDYPMLRMLYERYLDGLNICGVNTNALNYNHMDSFIELIGNYWVELIEQVIPSTTIWGATYKYSNTIFDNNKFKYRKSTLFVCNEPIQPIIGSEDEIEVIKTITINNGRLAQQVTTEVCNGVYVVQIDDGSEFIGSVNILGQSGLNYDSGDIIILNETFEEINP